MQTIKSKITIKDLLSPRDPPADGSLKPLGKIFGIASGTRIVKDAKGDVFTALTGQFGAIGEGKPVESAVRSGTLYLPTSFHDEILAALKNSETKGAHVKFAYTFFSQVSTSPAGYQYAATSLLAPAVDDPLAGLLRGAVPGIAVGAENKAAIGHDAAPAAAHETKAKKPHAA